MSGHRIKQTIKASKFRLLDNSSLLKLFDAIVRDMADGFRVTIVPQLGFSKFANRVIRSLAAHLTAMLVYRLKATFRFGETVDGAPPPPDLDLTWIEGEEIPMAVTIDLEYVMRPGTETVKIKGGPYDDQHGTFEGRTKVVFDPRNAGDGESHYVWDGREFVFSYMDEPVGQE